MTRAEKITLGAMRSSGIRGQLIYCADYKCAHSIAISADQWPDDMRLSDLGPLFGLTPTPRDDEVLAGYVSGSAYRVNGLLRQGAPP